MIKKIIVKEIVKEIVVFILVFLVMTFVYIAIALKYAYNSVTDFDNCTLSYYGRYDGCTIYKVLDCPPPTKFSPAATKIFRKGNGVILLWTDDKRALNVEKCNCRNLDPEKGDTYNYLVDIYCNLRYIYVGWLFGD